MTISSGGDATFSGKVKVSDGGNATTPSFRMVSDTNGISTPSTNQLNFITNSLTRLAILSGGNVGIGTDSPNYLLDLQSSGTGLTHNLKLNKGSATGDYAEIAFQLWNGAGSGLNTFGGSGTSRPSVVLRAINEASNSAAGAFVVGTFTGGANNSTLTEKFRISSGGDAQFKSVKGSGESLNVKILDSNTNYAQGTGGGLLFQGVFQNNGNIAGGGAIQISKVNSNNGDYSYDMDFYTRPLGSAITKRLTIPSGGGLIISGSNNTAASLQLTNTSSSSTWFINTQYDNGDLRFLNGSVDAMRISSGGDVQVKGTNLGVTQSDGDYLAKLYQSSADGFLSLYTGQATPLEKVRISSYGNSWFVPAADGKVGIGETNPVNKLEVNGAFAAPLTSGSAQNGIARFSQTLGNGVLDIGFGDPYTWLQSRDSTSYSTAYYLALNPTGGNVLIGATTRLSGYNAHNIIHTSQSGYACIISQQDTNTSNNSVLQLNRAEVNATTGGYCLIYRQGNASSGTNRFIVFANGNVQNSNNSYGQLSDIKLKENVADATPKLNDLLKVKVKNFNFIGENTKQIGVIAQELEKIFPSMIDESPDTEDREVTDEEGNVTNEKVDLGTVTKSVKYSVFTPMLIKAIQEQQTIIEDLKSRIETLEG